MIRLREARFGGLLVCQLVRLVQYPHFAESDRATATDAPRASRGTIPDPRHRVSIGRRNTFVRAGGRRRTGGK